MLSHCSPIVWAIFIVDSIQTGIMTQYAWHYAVDIWGNPESLITYVPPSGGLVTVFDGIGMPHCHGHVVFTADAVMQLP